ncbi:VOC family protein [Hyphococcus sp.]|uniref:VOC family protein n=1 Tax=Hyphococcus sp. TaxID=2038636 RepID=UPI003CCBFA08
MSAIFSFRQIFRMGDDMKIFPVIICALFMQATAACASAAQNDASVQEDLTPRLIAISVSDLDDASAWYVTYFNFEETKRYAFPEDGMRIAFLERNGFELELIEIANAAPYAAPDPDNPSTRQGYNKLAFYSEDIDALYTNAQDRGAQVHSVLSNSNRTGGRFFILLDPDGNWVQVFGPALQSDK